MVLCNDLQKESYSYFVVQLHYLNPVLSQGNSEPNTALLSSITFKTNNNKRIKDDLILNGTKKQINFGWNTYVYGVNIGSLQRGGPQLPVD